MQQATLGNRYRLLDKLGGGGMAKVYLARDEVLEREVAVKMLREQFAEDEEFVERFRREARSAASLRHQNIVQIYDQGESEDGSHFMAMEYVSGGTLKEKISHRGRLSSDEAARIALKVAEALGAAHDKGVVHRDIKPQNVLLTETGEPKVADFGIARAASAATISQTSRVLGTAGYMSPEQALGEKACPRSDLYSLGIVLYEMLVGELPYEADTPVAVAVKHINEPPPSPAEVNEKVSPGLAEITLKLLAKSPEDRYPDAEALAEDLRRVIGGFPPEGAKHAYVPAAGGFEDDLPTRVSPGGTTARRKKRGAGVLRVAVAVVAGLLLLGGVVFAAIEAPWEETGESAAPQAEVPAEPQPPEVPDVVGLGEEEARATLQGEGFEVEASETGSSAEDEGTVLRQSVGAGERAEEGSTVEISVGSGPATVEAPNLVYESEAPAQLAEADLELGSVSYSPSNTVAAGVVISQTPAAGTEVEEGTSVDIVVSTGPEPVQPQSVEPAPVQPEPAQPQSVEPTPVQPEPVEPDPAQPEPVEPQPESAQPDGQSMADEIIDGVFNDVGIERNR